MWFVTADFYGTPIFKSFAVEEFQDQSVARHQGQAHPGSVQEQGSAAPDQDQGAAV